MADPVIVIHGGAWAIPDTLVSANIAGVQNAARAGWQVLTNGGSAIDATEAAITVLENDPTFDAGTGSVLTADETVEMDAIIMDGATLNFGAIASVQNIKNPISLARRVMDSTEHTLLVGPGANKFAQEVQIPTVPLDSLATPAAWEELQRFKTYNKSVTGNFSERSNYNSTVATFLGHDTVGCVARDIHGNLASGTSTGGITGKRSGRVGDSPLVGSGAYADSASAAVSTTGHGESISKVCLARRIVEGCEKGLKPSDAIQHGLSFMRSRVGNAGGAISIDSNGNPGIGFNTERMSWALITKDSSQAGINPGQKINF